MLKVSSNRRFLVHEDGSPFFYLGDTAWELFHRLTTSEAERYLQDRAAKGFTVIQAVALAEIDGLHTPNMRGELPLIFPTFATLRTLADFETLGSLFEEFSHEALSHRAEVD